jgi:hypothetical protein
LTWSKDSMLVTFMMARMINNNNNNNNNPTELAQSVKWPATSWGRDFTSAPLC